MFIQRILLEKLTKLELPQLANSVIELVEEYDSETLKVTEAFKLLTEKQSMIDYLEVSYGPHPLTPQLSSLREKRHTFASALTVQMGVVSKTAKDDPGYAMKTTQMLINRYLINLRAHNEKEISQKLFQFFNKIDTDEILEEALGTFNLTSYANELRNVQSEILELSKKRYDSISKRPRKSTPLYIQSVRTSLYNLFRQINYAKQQYPEVNYEGFIERLNVELISYNNLINMRATILKKKKGELEKPIENEEPIENEDGEKNDVENDNGEMGVMNAPRTTLRMTESLQMASTPNEDEMQENGFTKLPLNEKKTAARSSKNEQLPSIDDEEIVS